MAKTDARYPLTHKGFGRYELNGTLYPTKADAEAARAQLLANEEQDSLIGDLPVEGMVIRDRNLEFRGSVMEVPMNEPYLTTGELNPMYDRQWYYGWARMGGSSIARYQSRGYRPVRLEELEEMVEAGKAPAHYLSALQRQDSFLTYGDAVLMRIPRIAWRQQKEADRQRALKTFQRVQSEQDANAANIGLQPAKAPIENEVIVRT